MIFPATLVISQNDDSTKACLQDIFTELNHSLKINDPDIYQINSTTGWGIDQIRILKKFLSQKPYASHNKIIIIHSAENLLPEAQNALLKTLEEPGPDNYLILTTSKSSSLLSTIISRCHLHRTSPVSDIKPAKLLVSSGNLKKDLENSDELSANKESVLPLLEDQLTAYQQQLVSNPSLKTAQTINKLIKSINLIKAHVDPKSALDFFYLSS